MRRIGFLDSGIGGLTVLNAFTERAQNKKEAEIAAEIIYLADLANLPYGPKTQAELREILFNNLGWFEGKVDRLVLACNTSSALLDERLKKQFKDIQIFSLISALELALKREHAALKSIAVFSTLATHSSGAYLRAFENALPAAQHYSIPCPALVPLIEANLSLGSEKLNATAEEAVRKYAAELPFEPAALVFGCTHYPLLKATFKKLFPKTILLDPAEALCFELGQLCFDRTQSKLTAFASGETAALREKIGSLKGVLRCAEYFGAEVKLAETTARGAQVKPLRS